MAFLIVLVAACLLDLALGDPPAWPHPVRCIGGFAAKTEAFTRSLPLSARNSGRLTVLLVLPVTGGSTALSLLLLSLLPEPVFLAAAACMLHTCIAARDLLRHARQVVEALEIGLDRAREQVGLLVGRDTGRMDRPAVIRACVESVAENMSDGIVAPLFWAIGGAALALPLQGPWPVVCGVCAAMLYKAVNTMDSMFGYIDERYLEFGSWPARLDDRVNFLPARISGLALVCMAPLVQGSLQGAWRILRRDRRKHASPNAGWPEAAAAGALGLQLGGDAFYFGKKVRKPVLGDPLRPPEPEHILAVSRLVLTASLFCLLVFIGAYLGLYFSCCIRS